MPVRLECDDLAGFCRLRIVEQQKLDEIIAEFGAGLRATVEKFGTDAQVTEDVNKEINRLLDNFKETVRSLKV